MSLHTIFQDLKTINKTINLPITTQIRHRTIAEAIISSAAATTSTLPSPLSSLTPNLIKSILSDPHITTHQHLPSSTLPSKTQIQHYTTLLSSAMKSNNGYSTILSKLFNKLLKVYSDCGKFDTVLETFNFMRSNGIEVYERSCCVYLMALIRSDQLGLCLSFFYKMMECEIHVSAYSLAIVVDGLCKNGEIKRGRELVQEASSRSIKPNVAVFNVLIDSCCKRWNFEELDLVLLLMEDVKVGLDMESYRFLIDGFLSCGKVEDAERMVMDMHDKDLNVEIHLWNSIVRKYCELGKMGNALQVFDKMTDRSVLPDAETYRVVVSGICGVGEMEAAKGLADELLRQGVDLGYDVFGDLVDGWCKKGEFGNAVGLLKTMERKGLCGDVSLYNMIVVGLCESNRAAEATRFLSFVVKCGAVPESFINVVKDQN